MNPHEHRAQEGVDIVYEYLIGSLSYPDMVEELRERGFDVVMCNTGRQVLRDAIYGGTFDAGL